MIVNVCNYWNDQSYKSTTEIANEFKISRPTVIRYLKKGTQIGICYYDAKMTRINNIKSMYKPVVQLSLNGDYIKEWESTTIACDNLKLARTNVYGALRSKSHISEGYKWMWVDEYNDFMSK